MHEPGVLPAGTGSCSQLCALVSHEDLSCLLEALAWWPHLGTLCLSVFPPEAVQANDDLHWPFPAPALAKLSSLTSLALTFNDEPSTLADVVGALASLTGLVDVYLALCKYADVHLVPAALGQLQALQSLEFDGMRECVLEGGCLDLPELQCLKFTSCYVSDADVLPGVSALQCLTSIEFSGGLGPVTLDPQLAHLPGLQRLVFSQELAPDLLQPPGPLRLPADMGSLSSTLLHLDISGHMGTRFPLSLTQLVALEHLNAKENGFAELPAGITALTRLTELMLGRVFVYDEDPLQLREKRPLDVRALGDLYRFPGLRKLTFDSCKVMLCCSVLGAVRHASLTSLCFCNAHPAPECAPAVLQVSQELWLERRGSVLRAVCEELSDYIYGALRDAQGCAPCQLFMADLEECRLEACEL